MEASHFVTLFIGAILGFGLGWHQKWHTDRRLELHGVRLESWDTKKVATINTIEVPVQTASPEVLGRGVTA